MGPLAQLNVAAWCEATVCLGPGVRSVLWVQGCPFSCPNCIAPEWIPMVPATSITPEEAARLLTKDDTVTGVTLSGGEPMLQADTLAETLRIAQRRRHLNVICFTGFRIERLIEFPPSHGVKSLLDSIDVLIDGQYVDGMNDGVGLRGSSNQRVHFLTDALKSQRDELVSGARSLEVRFQRGEALLVGVPEHRKLMAVNDLLRQPGLPHV